MSQQIYIGRWTDWSYGSVLGARITMRNDNARYLTNFIAAFNLWVGSAVWNLFAFVWHQHRSTNAPADVMFHQSQVALRNASTPLAFKKSVFSIGLAWRKRTRQSLSRASRLLIGPSILSLLFSAASLFSARIASTGEVLMQGGTCGLIPDGSVPKADSLTFTFVQNSQDRVRMFLSNAYAQECYNNSLNPGNPALTNADASGLSCHGYVMPSLNFTTSTTSICPFESACASSGPGIIHLDTGYLDSHTDLGLNQPQENRVSFRKVTTCSPMSTEGFSEDAFTTEYYGNISVYSYGQNLYQPTRFAAPTALPGPNTTFVYGADSYTGSQSAYYLM
jgi:hypothetical protein